MKEPGKKDGVIGWIDHRLPIFTFLQPELHEYPTPGNLNYLWNFGSLAGIVLVIMIVTNIVLAMHYTATTAGETRPLPISISQPVVPS